MAVIARRKNAGGLAAREQNWGADRPPAGSRRACPVRIYTLGRFSVTLHRQALTTHHKRRYQRPLELLQALIALGGREVHVELLSQALWPDADGDRAQNTFDVTLHRLRQLCNVETLLLLRDRRLSLNGELAWVDVWSFEQVVNYAEDLLVRLDEPGVGRQLVRCEERLFGLYQGAFLEREAIQPWALTLRERLRSKLLRHVAGAGKAWEAAGDWDRAIRYYQKGLEVDPLIEELYRRLMFCFRQTKRTAEALAVFERCRAMLSTQLKITPSRDTIDLLRSLKP
jgi:two-component SAPR family response regulator